MTQTKQVKHTPISGKWRVTKAFDDDGFYIRCTSEDGTDTPVAITRHGDQKDAQNIVNALNSHEELLGALELDLLFHSRHFSADSLADFQAAGYRGSSEAPEMRAWLVARKKAAIAKARGES